MLKKLIDLIISKMHHSISKIPFVLGADEYLETLEGKIRNSLFFLLKYSEIAVCCLETSPLREVHAGGAWAPFTAI